LFTQSSYFSPRLQMWRPWPLAGVLLLLARLAGGDMVRVVEVFEPFPFTPEGTLRQLMHATEAVKSVGDSVFIYVLARSVHPAVL
jgi:hypothetical protein